MSTNHTQEPTVLDYVKSKLFFWRGERIEISGEPQELEHPIEVVQDEEIQPAAAVVSAVDFVSLTQPTTREKLNLWLLARFLMPVLLALAAQRLLEPPERAVASGVVLYAMAAVWVVWVGWRGEWQLATREVQYRLGWEDDSFRLLSMGISAVLALIAFLAFGDNRFTAFNLVIWALALFFFLYAVWQVDLESLSWTGKIRNTWESFISEGISFSPWTLLVIAAFGLTIFFRFYMIDQVPKEMFSDHAEKLLDVSEVLSGEYRVFFPRNTGREAFQMYLTAAMALIFNTGLSFMSLKLGTIIAGVLTLPFIYLTGKEIANRRVGLLAMVFAGIAYWPNVISRVALRFTLYPFFFAPTMYFMVRGFRRRSRNDFILAGIFLGLGLHGYSPFRFVPLLVLVAFGLYLLHRQSQGARKLAVGWLALTGFTSLIVFVPLLRYWVSNPDMFSYRALTRLTGIEQALPSPAWQIFLKNTWNALIMFFWDDGEIWVHSVTHRPALDVISAALFFIGVILLVVRYIRHRDWLDLFWLISIPLLMMPSILSLAFPAENPALNRTGAAIVPVFLIVGLCLDGFISSFGKAFQGSWGNRIALGMVAFLLLISINLNYDLVFRQFKTQFDMGSWNTSELGAVIRQYADTIGDEDSAWVIPFPHWVDTRLVGIRAGVPLRDYALSVDSLDTTLEQTGVKMFLFRPEDVEARDSLEQIYPDGYLSLYESDIDGKDFYIYIIPAAVR